MTSGLRPKLIVAVVTATTALMLAMLLLEGPIVGYRETQRVQGELLAAAREVAAAVDLGTPPDEAADRVGAQTGTRILVLGPGGRVLGDTARDGEALSKAPPMGGGSEIAQARRRGTGTAVARDPATSTPWVYAAVARDGRIIVASRSAASIDAARDELREVLLLGGAVAVLAAVLLTIALSHTMVRPMRELTRVADALSAGDLEVRTRAQGNDELGRLGRALDRMADQLRERLRNLRAEEARLRTVLDAMVEAVFVTDAKGRIVLTNAALDRMVNGPVRGRTAIEAIRSPELHDAVQRAREGETVTVDFGTRVEAEERSIAAHLAPLPDKAGVVSVLHDVTEMKRADRVRRDFVANASHELRTPLTAIRGFAETLRDGAVQDPEASTRFLDTIVRHTLRLQRLVDDLLLLSRAESPDEHYEVGPVDVGPVATDVVRGLGAQAAAKDITVRLEGVDGLPAAHASEDALDQVLVNLVDNAIKYTPQGGQVIVRGRSDDGRVTLEVTDTGPGIPPHHAARIFERFYRVDKGRSREVGGTGLGLSIVKHLVQRMGADVVVDSRVGGGTTFRIILPVEAPSPEPPAAPGT